MATKKFCDCCGVEIATQVQSKAFKIVVGHDYHDIGTGDGRDCMSFLPYVWFADACEGCIEKVKGLFEEKGDPAP